MRKKILSILMCFALMAGVAACTASSVTPETDDSQQLLILKSDMKLSQEDVASQIKAEYLIENNGYKDDDVITAIVKLPGNALIDTFLAGSKYGSVAEYAADEYECYGGGTAAYAAYGLVEEHRELHLAHKTDNADEHREDDRSRKYLLRYIVLFSGVETGGALEHDNDYRPDDDSHRQRRHSVVEHADVAVTE